MSESAAVMQGVALAAPITVDQKNRLFQETEILVDWLRVLKWCLIPILICTVYWAIEKYVLQFSDRLIPNPAEFPCRFFGFSHYLVGLVFMLTSKKMKRLSSWIWLTGLLIISLMLAAVFNKFGGERNAVMVSFYFLFFMVHGYRDMVLFYRSSADDPVTRRLQSQVWILIQGALLLSLFYFLTPAYLFYSSTRPRHISSELQAQVNLLLPFLYDTLKVAWIFLLASIVGLWQLMKKLPGGWAGMWGSDRAVFLVLLYSSLIILTSALVGPWVYNLLILSHFVGWYFYASRRLTMVPRQSSRVDGLWQWFRGSVAGFQSLHLGVAAIFLVAILINHFALKKVGILNTLVSARAFYYWTVIHVTISFSPKS
ncbi:MAG TPA: hypothetical protein VIV66_16810 [Pyrinomonadaceae bacterium]